MIARRTSAWTLPALLVVAAACSDETTEPNALNTEIDAAEAQFLAVEMESLMDGVLGDVFGFQGIGLTGSAAPSSTAMPSSTTTFEFERTRTCRIDGQIVVTGAGTFIVDGEARTMEMSVAGTKSLEDCAFQKEDIVYTINGGSEWDAYWKMGGEQRLEAEWNTTGSFTVTTSDDRTEDCDFELHTVWDPETKSIHTTGEFCGVEVDRVWTHGHDRDGDRGGHHNGRGG